MSYTPTESDSQSTTVPSSRPSPGLRFSTWNVHSLRNKHVVVSDTITSCGIDLLVTTESWHQSSLDSFSYHILMKFSLNVHWYMRICFAKIYRNIHSIRFLTKFKRRLGWPRLSWFENRVLICWHIQKAGRPLLLQLNWWN